MRALETRLGVRLLTRTTRSVSPTEAGQRLYQSMAPRFDEIELELAAVSEFRDTPAGNVRISASEHAANNILWPKLLKVLPDYRTSRSKSRSTTPFPTSLHSAMTPACVWAIRWRRT
jgi:DNA-binding transcriptional LysR family regulator